MSATSLKAIWDLLREIVLFPLFTFLLFCFLTTAWTCGIYSMLNLFLLWPLGALSFLKYILTFWPTIFLTSVYNFTVLALWVQNSRVL